MKSSRRNGDMNPLIPDDDPSQMENMYDLNLSHNSGAESTILMSSEKSGRPQTGFMDRAAAERILGSKRSSSSMINHGLPEYQFLTAAGLQLPGPSRDHRFSVSNDASVRAGASTPLPRIAANEVVRLGDHWSRPGFTAEHSDHRAVKREWDHIQYSDRGEVTSPSSPILDLEAADVSAPGISHCSAYLLSSSLPQPHCIILVQCPPFCEMEVAVV